MKNRNQESIRYYFGGINNRLDGSEATISKSAHAISQLESTDNVYITDKYGIRSREGQTLVLPAENSHSLFTENNFTFFVHAGYLHQFDAVTKTSTPGYPLIDDESRMYYVCAGTAIIFSNGIDIGIFLDGQFSAPIKPTREYKKPLMPLKHLAWFNGRVFGSNDNGLIFTDTYNFDSIDEEFSELPLGQINMIAPVEDGIYVSANNSILFLQGTGPEDFIVKNVGTEGAIDGAYLLSEARYFKSDSSGQCVVFATAEGVFVGYRGGVVQELTDGAYSVGDAMSGTMFLHKHGSQASVYLSIIKE